MKVRLTKEADRDIARIINQTNRLFGRNQVLRYSEILSRGIAMIAENPNRASSQERSDLRKGVRSFHLQIAAGRRGAAAHIVYYRVLGDGGRSELLVIRVLDDAMEPRNRVVRALRED